MKNFYSCTRNVSRVALLSIFSFVFIGCDDIRTLVDRANTQINYEEQSQLNTMRESQKAINEDIKRVRNKSSAKTPESKEQRISDLKTLERNVKKLQREVDELVKKSKYPSIRTSARSISDMLKQVYDIIQILYKLPEKTPAEKDSTRQEISNSLKEMEIIEKPFFLTMKSFVEVPEGGLRRPPLYMVVENPKTTPTIQKPNSAKPFIVINKSAHLDHQFFVRITSPDEGQVTITKVKGSSVSIKTDGGPGYDAYNVSPRVVRYRYQVTLKGEGTSILTIRKEATEFYPEEERTLIIKVPELLDFFSVKFKAGRTAKTITYDNEKNLINIPKGNEGKSFTLTFKEEMKNIRIKGLARSSGNVPYEGELKIEKIDSKKYKIIVNTFQTYRDKMLRSIQPKDLTLLIQCPHNKQRTIQVSTFARF